MGITSKQRGKHYFPGGITEGQSYAYPADGPIQVVCGLHKLTKATAGAYTLAAPTGLADGTRIRVRSTTAMAHVVTVTGGFGGVGGATDTATFAAAAGNGFSAEVVNGLWFLESANGVTVS